MFFIIDLVSFAFALDKKDPLLMHTWWVWTMARPHIDFYIGMYLVMKIKWNVVLFIEIGNRNSAYSVVMSVKLY